MAILTTQRFFRILTESFYAGLWSRELKLWAFSTRPNIPIWNSGYSMSPMEQYCTNPSLVFTLQVSHENTKTNKRKKSASLCLFDLFYDCGVETNDVLGEDVTFKSSLRLTTLRERYLHFRMARQAVHSHGHDHLTRSLHVFSHHLLMLAVANQLQ